MSVVETQYVSGPIAVVDEDGRNLRIYITHTPRECITIECADRHDLLRCLLAAQGVELELVKLVDPAPQPIIITSKGPS